MKWLRRQQRWGVGVLLAVLSGACQDSTRAEGPPEPSSGAAAADPVDTFAFPGEASIQDEIHCGIVNGLLAPGIPHQSLARVSGLWAPPYVSGDFNLNVTVLDKDVPTQRYTWWPFKVERRADVEGLRLSTATVLAAGKRAGILAVTVENTSPQPREVPLRCAVRGKLDRSNDGWGFRAPQSRAATIPAIADGALLLRQKDLAIAIRAVPDLTWDAGSCSGAAARPLKPGERATQYLVFAIGSEADAAADCKALAADPAAALRQAHDEHRRRVLDLFEKLPRLESSNAALARWYTRSLVHFLMNRWDVPEFALRPFYGTGSTRGGCVCSYLWNFGEVWEILPLYEPKADREHIMQYLRNDMMAHLAIDPISGKALGPWYPVGQEKLIGLIYYFVKITGDTAFLNEEVNGKSILEHAIIHAFCRDDQSKPVALVDYGPANDHLELRRGLPYNHQMPDLNGRRYANYLMAARLADVAGKPVPELRRRAADLKTLFKKEMWDAGKKWFVFISPKGRDIRWTNQMFKIFGSGVLDGEMEAGLLSHLNEKEFLSDYGLHSLAKDDPAYDPKDIDNGGPGSCTSFPPQIAERLYKAGRLEAAEDLVRRTLWWGEKLPYWGDSMVADKPEYRKDTPLQCMVDGVAIAQGVIFGMFGIDARFEGGIVICPHPPKFAPRMALKGVKLRGAAFDVIVEDGQVEVRSAGRSARAPVGKAVLLKDGALSILDAPPPHAF
jgi:hypothetical protein